jgi:hypothetical protein
VAEKHFLGLPAVETPQVARRRILPEFFRSAACPDCTERAFKRTFFYSQSMISGFFTLNSNIYFAVMFAIKHISYLKPIL